MLVVAHKVNVHKNKSTWQKIYITTRFKIKTSLPWANLIKEFNTQDNANNVLISQRRLKFNLA